MVNCFIRTLVKNINNFFCKVVKPMLFSDKIIPLTKAQKEVVQEFYNITPIKVIFNKKDRADLWKKAMKRNILDWKYIRNVCPALENQIQKSYKGNHNIQSAVFSECVYAQTYANMLKLDKFVICDEDSNFIPRDILSLIKSYNLFPRYAYFSENKNRMLIQAGGCNGVDSALITVVDLVIYTITFDISNVRQLNPTIAGKLFFSNLKYSKVKSHYEKLF